MQRMCFGFFLLHSSILKWAHLPISYIKKRSIFKFVWTNFTPVRHVHLNIVEKKRKKRIRLCAILRVCTFRMRVIKKNWASKDFIMPLNEKEREKEGPCHSSVILKGRNERSGNFSIAYDFSLFGSLYYSYLSKSVRFRSQIQNVYVSLIILLRLICFIVINIDTIRACDNNNLLNKSWNCYDFEKENCIKKRKPFKKNHSCTQKEQQQDSTVISDFTFIFDDHTP